MDIKLIYNKYYKLGAIALIALIIVGLVVTAGFILYKGKGGKTILGICSQETKKCPDGLTLKRSGPNCEMPKCPAQSTNRITIDTYSVEKVLSSSCLVNDDCKLPAEYAPLTNCKFDVMCLENKCNVICPQKLRVTKDKLLEFQKYQESQQNKNTDTK